MEMIEERDKLQGSNAFDPIEGTETSLYQGNKKGQGVVPMRSTRLRVLKHQ